MPKSGHAEINLRRLAMQLGSQLPSDGKTAREVLGYMEELISWETEPKDAQVVALTVAASK